MIALAADEDVSVTAGIGGFLVFFFLAIALWLLMRNMFARIRRVRYREEARLEAERAAAAGRETAGESRSPDDGAEGADGRPGGKAEPPGDGTDDTPGTEGTPGAPKRSGDGRADDPQAP